jgi:competence protein ComEA
MPRLRAVLIALLVLTAIASGARAGKAVDGVVNLNTADAGVLGLLPGIGPAKAAEIVAYRKRHPFRTVDELVRIKGIGRKMVRAWRAHLAVTGPTTAKGTVIAPGALPPAPPPRPSPPPVRPLCAKPPIPLVRPATRGKREPQPTHGACFPPA